MLEATAMRVVEKVPERYQNTARQFIKFGLTGTMGAVIDFGTYNIITRVIGWEEVYLVWGYQIIGANLISVSFAIFCMFFVNKYWTFRDRSQRAMQQGASYFALNGVTFVLNQILTSFFAFHVPIIRNLFGDLTDNAAKAIAIGLILFLNFFGSKLLIFRKREVVPSPEVAEGIE